MDKEEKIISFLKESTEELLGVEKRSLDIQDNHIKLSQKLAENQEAVLDLIRGIYDVFNSFFKIIKLVLFIIGILVWRVFLWDSTNELLSAMISQWGQLSEGYKILILGLIGTFFFGVLAQVVGMMIKDKIDTIVVKKIK